MTARFFALRCRRDAASASPNRLQVAVRSEWPEDVLRRLHQQPAHEAVSLLRDPQLRVRCLRSGVGPAPARGTAPPSGSSRTGPGLQRQDVGQRHDRAPLRPPAAASAVSGYFFFPSSRIRLVQRPDLLRRWRRSPSGPRASVSFSSSGSSLTVSTVNVRVEHFLSRCPVALTAPRTWLISFTRVRTSTSRARSTARSCATLLGAVLHRRQQLRVQPRHPRQRLGVHPVLLAYGSGR